MFIDHVAGTFIPYGTLLYSFMRFIGRTTAPVMCFFISEGYHHTRNLKKYFQRMAIFAFISHFAFVYHSKGTFAFIGKSSMITTLLLSLTAVYIINSEKIDKAYKLPAILFISLIAKRCDWGSEAVIYTLAFELARESRKKQIIAYIGAISVFKVIPFIWVIIKDISYFQINWMQLGVILPIPLIMLYNGERGGGKYTKWFFYIFYPAHLVLLTWLYNRYCV